MLYEFTALRQTDRGAPSGRTLRPAANDVLQGWPAADFVVAVKEAEHRPLMRLRFAEWEHLSDYWNVHDIGDAEPAEALKMLAQEVQALVLRFRKRPYEDPALAQHG